MPCAGISGRPRLGLLARASPLTSPSTDLTVASSPQVRQLCVGISAHQKLDLLANLVTTLGYEGLAVFGDCFDEVRKERGPETECDVAYRPVVNYCYRYLHLCCPYFLRIVAVGWRRTSMSI